MAFLLQLGAVLSQGQDVVAFVQPWLLGGSYLVLLAGAKANLHFWGFRLFLLGLGLNFLAIALNGWRMPISPEALIQAGYVEEASLESGSYFPLSKGVLLHKEDTRVWFLTDIFPATRPVRRVVSIGDLIIFIAALVILVELVVRREGKKPTGRKTQER